jgi:histone acetyltransferase (RNA polymerase elongator complex component)
MKAHYTIPFFIPHKGCLFTCIFCNQRKISGTSEAVLPADIKPTIKRYLKTIPRSARIEVGFFGGSFTGLDKSEQEAYLKEAYYFLNKKKIQGIRLSTRPDYISEDRLKFLKKYGVSCIELGVQSMSDNVLSTAERGHSFRDIKIASGLIIKHGFTLGHQIMLGLPGSTMADERKTAKLSISMGSSEIRIYPAVVIKDTALAKMYKRNYYNPLTEESAIKRSAWLIRFFEKHGVVIIRCGLHPSEGLVSGRDILAGPFHPAFRQKVESYIYRMLLKPLYENSKKKISRIFYNPEDAPYIVGYKRSNAKMFEEKYRKRRIFRQDNSIQKGEIKVCFEKGKSKTLHR